MKLIGTDLIKIFNGNERWKAAEMNIGEVALICSGLSVMRIENEKFIADLSDVIKATLENASNMDLILLTKGTFYMRKFKYSHDLYARVHACCMTKFNKKEIEG